MTTKKTVRKKAVKRREIEDEDYDCGCEGEIKTGWKFWTVLAIAGIAFAIVMAYWLHEGTEADREVNPWNWD